MQVAILFDGSIIRYVLIYPFIPSIQCLHEIFVEFAHGCIHKLFFCFPLALVFAPVCKKKNQNKTELYKYQVLSSLLLQYYYATSGINYKVKIKGVEAMTKAALAI